MIATHHWSGSRAVRGRNYHIENARTGIIDDAYRHLLRAAWITDDGAKSVDFHKLKSLFIVYKNDSLTETTEFGTWDLNSDPRNGTPNIEIASLCMPGGATDFEGVEPFTIAHAWVHAYETAAICLLKGQDPQEFFNANVAPQLQNGPIFVFSTHGERAIQTKNYNVPGAGASSEAVSEEYGYFFGSGDSDSRADLFCLDGAWYNGKVTEDQCRSSAAAIRHHALMIIQHGLVKDFWGLDGPES